MEFTFIFDVRFPSKSGRGRGHLKRGVVTARSKEHAFSLVRDAVNVREGEAVIIGLKHVLTYSAVVIAA